jgi:alpha-tubulin suppressor-like RCC1 family protein
MNRMNLGENEDCKRVEVNPEVFFHKWVCADMGVHHSAACDANGHVYLWGMGLCGQLVFKMHQIYNYHHSLM